MTLRRSSRIVSQNGVSAPTGSSASVTVGKVASRKRNLDAGTSEKLTKKLRTTTTQTVSEESTFKKPPVVTPIKSRSSKRTKVPPLTPTPSLIGLLKAPVTPYSTGDIDDITPPPDHPISRSRPVDPHLTNATLATPGGTEVTTFPPQTGSQTNASPSKQVTTTLTLLDKANAHLISVDSRFAPLIAKHPCPIFSPTGLAETIDPFRSLVSGICGQQVSGAAAKAIKNKFVALFNTEKAEGVPHVWPSPSEVASTKIEKLRTAGLSQRKAEYVQGLAEKFASGEFTTSMLLNASDEDLLETLIAVRGLGRWSVEMFACFGLKRMDILSTGDLGVQRGMASWAGKDVGKLKAKGGGKWKYMSEADMMANSEPYRPYRSLFMWYMWRVEDVDVSVMN